MSKPLYSNVVRTPDVVSSIEALTKLLAGMPEKEKEIYERVTAEQGQLREALENFQTPEPADNLAAVYGDDLTYQEAYVRRQQSARAKAAEIEQAYTQDYRGSKFAKTNTRELITGSMVLSGREAEVRLDIELASPVYLDDSVDIEFRGKKYIYIKIPEMGVACLATRGYKALVWCEISDTFGDYKMVAALLDRLSYLLDGPPPVKETKAKREKQEQTRPFEF
jgi:hypothetical protein